MEKLAIVDTGTGNLRSAEKAVQRAAEALGRRIDVRITADPDWVAAADRVIFPGQGAFADVRHGLERIDGLREAVTAAAQNRAVPVLGICVGMQLFADQGLEHGTHAGLGWISGTVAPIAPLVTGLKVPHMGWNALEPTAAGRAHPVLAGLKPQDHVYFVHSYAFTDVDPRHLLATARYGGDLTAIIGRDTMIGMQFHPEKSQAVGLALLSGFLDWKP